MHIDNQTGELMILGGNINKEAAKQETKEEVEVVRKEMDFNLKVEIDDKVFQKIMYWIDKADFEVSGLGMIEYNKDHNILRITDAMLLKQAGSGAATEIDAAAVAKAMFLMKDKPGSLRWWWHSHVNMSVFWSGTDQDTIKELGGGGWFAATVFNKKREMKSAYCQAAPVRLVISDIETNIVEDVDLDLINKWDKEFDDNVEHKVYTQSDFSELAQYGGYGSAWDNLPDELKMKILMAESEEDGDSVELNKNSSCLQPEECDNFPKEYDDDDAEEFERLIKQYQDKGFKFDDEDGD